MVESKYWISELAALTNVSPRTIRYYVQEGLLPQPMIRGKYAEFTEDYVHRLQLIKVLKDAYLPLNRIRELLNALKDDQVVPLLEEFEKDPVAALAGLQALPMFNQAQSTPLVLNSPARESALMYIQNLRSSGKERAINENASRRTARYINTPPPTAPDAVEWQRIRLAHGLELHVRQPIYPWMQALVKQIIELVQQQKSSQREEPKKQ